MYGLNTKKLISDRTIVYKSTAQNPESGFPTVQQPEKVRSETKKLDFQPYNSLKKYGSESKNLISDRIAA